MKHPKSIDSSGQAAPVGSAAPAGIERRQQAAAELLGEIARDMATEFVASNRVLSFGEYLDLFASHPVRHGRGAAEYVRDMFRFYGTETLERPWGQMQRHRLFDAPWDSSSGPTSEPRLLGHEALQAEVYRVLCNFAREGRANRLILMHGPNGSAKSTAAACMLGALEHYSHQEEGALYRFHWVFPTRTTSRGAIGFGDGQPSAELDSYAHLDEEQIEARLVIEIRDHPLFLLPAEHRRPLLKRLWEEAGLGGRPPEWLSEGELSHKNKQIFEALLASHAGALFEVLRHVQVERYFISRRYRVGAVTLGPEMSVDAHERQITADRSLAALPTSLQASTLFEAYGELVEAAGGMLELSDLLKRPIDAFRYLQLTLETAQASIGQQTLYTNVVMLGSANESHMAAFREHPEYASFRGRLELVRVPYLLHWGDEQAIYDTMVVPQLRRHVAPHCTTVAAEFAVLTRLRRPDRDGYDDDLADFVEDLTAVEKLDLYGAGKIPSRLDGEQRRLLRANVGALFHETDTAVNYEGAAGASPRSMRAVLLDAAQSDDYRCVSPFAVLDGIEELCQQTAELPWLRREPQPGGYQNHAAFLEATRERLIDRIEGDLRSASGLVEPQRYGELFQRYVMHVSAWVKGEKIRNEVTGKDEAADETLMGEVEGLLGVADEVGEHRHTIISMIAAWAIDNPGLEPPHDEIFPGFVDRLQVAAFAKLRKPLAELLRDLVEMLRGEGGALRAAERKRAASTAEHLQELGYCDACAADAASVLLRERYADLVG